VPIYKNIVVHKIKVLDLFDDFTFEGSSVYLMNNVGKGFSLSAYLFEKST